MKSQMMTFPANGRNTPGYLAQPNDGRAHPGIVVIQEWWGLVEHIKEVCDRFAAADFVARFIYLRYPYGIMIFLSGYSGQIVRTSSLGCFTWRSVPRASDKNFM